MAELLAWWDKKNKDKNGKHCHDQWTYFPPFILSDNGMLQRKALVILANLTRLMAEKMEEPILHVRVWVNGQTAITVARLYS